ncbi:hypothetical protein [Rhodococcus sovatensis]|uniref:Uncharacterized protein n=1 Tax=Rhodococcus sovatensis TaxID=1805840 RepID=A0ABZ2PN83_9NOCA
MAMIESSAQTVDESVREAQSVSSTLIGPMSEIRATLSIDGYSDAALRSFNGR